MLQIDIDNLRAVAEASIDRGDYATSTQLVAVIERLRRLDKVLDAGTRLVGRPYQRSERPPTRETRLKDQLRAAIARCGKGQ